MNQVIHTKNLQRFVDVVKELSLARSLDTVMAVVRRTARELTGADGATFVLRDRIGNAEACFMPMKMRSVRFGRGAVSPSTPASAAGLCSTAGPQ